MSDTVKANVYQRCPVGGAARFLMVELAEVADDRGVALASHEYLADRLGVVHRTLQRLIIECESVAGLGYSPGCGHGSQSMFVLRPYGEGAAAEVDDPEKDDNVDKVDMVAKGDIVDKGDKVDSLDKVDSAVHLVGRSELQSGAPTSAPSPAGAAPHVRARDLLSPNLKPIKASPPEAEPQAAVPTFAIAQVGPAPTAPGTRGRAPEGRPDEDPQAAATADEGAPPAAPRRRVRHVKKPADPRPNEMVQALEQWQGYPVVSWPQEMMGAKKLVQLGHDLEVVARVWHEMKHDPDAFWEGKHLSLQSVAGQIGARLASRRRGPLNLDDRGEGSLDVVRSERRRSNESPWR